MDGGPATATSPHSPPMSPAARRRRLGLTRQHKARGDGHDRLFRFEDLEGSAFDDILVGNGKLQRDQRRRGRRHSARRRRPRRAGRGAGNGRCFGAGDRGRVLRHGRDAQRLRLHRARRHQAAGEACRSSAAAGGTSSSSPSTRRRRGLCDHGRQRCCDRHRLRGGARHPDHLRRRRPGPLADGRPRPRRRQAHGRGLARRGRRSSASPAATATTRSAAAPRTT